MQQKGASSGCRRQTARQLPEGRPGATEDPPVGDPTPRLRACLRSSVMELKSVFGLKHEYPPDRGGKGLKSGGRVRGSERPSAAVTAERPAPAKRPRRRLGIKAEPCGRSCLTRSPVTPIVMLTPLHYIGQSSHTATVSLGCIWHGAERANSTSPTSPSLYTRTTSVREIRPYTKYAGGPCASNTGVGHGRWYN